MSCVLRSLGDGCELSSLDGSDVLSSLEESVVLSLSDGSDVLSSLEGTVFDGCEAASLASAFCLHSNEHTSSSVLSQMY